METNQKFYIFRTYSAGVFFGNKKFIPADVFYNDENQKGKTPVLVVTNCRRLWSWSGAASLTQLAVEGTKTTLDAKKSAAEAEPHNHAGTVISVYE